MDIKQQRIALGGGNVACPLCRIRALLSTSRISLGSVYVARRRCIAQVLQG